MHDSLDNFTVSLSLSKAYNFSISFLISPDSDIPMAIGTG
jgi:hypothetical protein